VGIRCTDHATDTIYPQKLAPTSPTCSGRSVGIVRLRTKDTGTEFFFYTNGGLKTLVASDEH
jgi:hypothetical protein